MSFLIVKKNKDSTNYARKWKLQKQVCVFHIRKQGDGFRYNWVINSS